MENLHTNCFITNNNVTHKEGDVVNIPKFDMQKTSYSIYDIANWFLNHVCCDQKKLQKLCYYAQAWHLALYNTCLCQASFEAWVHGPVNRELWECTRKFEFNDIPSKYFSSLSKQVDDNTDTFLTRVLATYGAFSGFDLECLTHVEDPWINARSGYGAAERCTVNISENDMKSYYRKLLSGDGIGEG